MSDCNGLFYRLDFSVTSTARGFMYSARFNKLKRKSCKGCAHCQTTEEMLSESLRFDDTSLVLPDDLHHKGIYQLIPALWETCDDVYGDTVRYPIKWLMEQVQEDET